MSLRSRNGCWPSTDIAEISADYPDQDQQTLERCYPAATAMFLNGCCGDVRPAIIQDNTFTGGSHEDAARMGRLLASEVIQGGYEARSFLSRLWPAPYAPDVESDLVRAAGRLLR